MYADTDATTQNAVFVTTKVWCQAKNQAEDWLYIIVFSLFLLEQKIDKSKGFLLSTIAEQNVL